MVCCGHVILHALHQQPGSFQHCRTLKLLLTLPRVYVLLDMSSYDHGVMSDLLLVLVDVADSRLDKGASLVDLLGTRIFCNTAEASLLYYCIMWLS